MDFIRDTMSLTPSTWDKTVQYTNKRYITVELEEESEEFTSVADDFRDQHHNITIKSIKRIQHPFAFARYNLHKEYLQATGNNVEENTIYSTCSAASADVYIDYNCDDRRQQSHSWNLVYIRRKILRDIVLGKRDSNSYPEYVIDTDKEGDFTNLAMINLLRLSLD